METIKKHKLAVLMTLAVVLTGVVLGMAAFHMAEAVIGGTGNVTTTPTSFVQDLKKDHSKHFSLTVKTPSSGDSPGGGEAIQAIVTIHAVQG